MNTILIGKYVGQGFLQTPTSKIKLLTQRGENEEVILPESLENEGLYAVVQGELQNTTMKSTTVVESIPSMSSTLLDLMLSSSSGVRNKVLKYATEIKDTVVGDILPDKSDENHESESDRITTSQPKPVCAVVVGHRKSAKGAQGKLNNNIINEFDYNDELADKIQELSQSAEIIKVYRDNTKDGYSKLPSKLNRINPAFIVSLHANAYNKKTSGVEVLCYKNSKNGKKLGRLVFNEFSSALGLKKRSVKEISSTDRGGHLLKNTKAPAIIGEPFFIDNPKDLQVAVEKKEALAKAYATAIDTYAENISTGAASKTITKVSTSRIDKNQTFELLHENLTKKQFFDQNRSVLSAMVNTINDSLADQYGNTVPLTMLDCAVLLNCEAGMKGSQINIYYKHSENEVGLFPLPSNIKHWNGSNAPSWDRPMPLAVNVEQFLMYLGQLKNKPGYYKKYFHKQPVKNDKMLQTNILAGVVHGYFYSANYKTKPNYTKIWEKFSKGKTIVQALTGTTYRHLGTDILPNRQRNIDKATEWE